MAKKAARKKSKKSKKKKKSVAAPMKDRAHKVWLAGLGALSVAEAEGSKLFNQLVEKGTDLEQRGKPVVDKMVKKATDTAAGVRRKASARAGKVGDEAKAGWAKVESAVDDKVTSALRKLGIPTRREIEELTRRVAALTAKLDAAPTKKTAKKTTKKPAKKAAKKVARTTARKPAKKAAAQKTVARKTAARKSTGGSVTPAAGATE